MCGACVFVCVLKRVFCVLCVVCVSCCVLCVGCSVCVVCVCVFVSLYERFGVCVCL